MILLMKRLCEKLWNKLKGYSGQEMTVPQVLPDEIHRYRITFSGIVQGVGFRFEVWRRAEKLGLTGFVQNLSNGDVYSEIQGPENKIRYLIESMKSIPRIQIENMEIEAIDLKEEKEFMPIY